MNTTEMITESQLPLQVSLRRRIRKWLVPGLFMLAFVAVGGGLGARLLLSAPPSEEIYKQQIAIQSFIRSVQQADDEVQISGAYVPETGYMLYSRVGSNDETQVRNWISQWLKSSSSLLDSGDDQDVIWIVDYGTDPMQQLILKTSLNHVADPSTYHLVYVPSSEAMLASAQPEVRELSQLADIDVSNTLVPEPESKPESEPTTVGANIEPQSSETQAVLVPEAQGFEPSSRPVAITQPYSSDFETSTSGWVPISGQWRMEDGVYSQLDTNGYDLITMFDVEAGSYHDIVTRFRHLEGAQGAGLIYHAPNTNSRADAQVIDFADQGSFLRWGHYASDGNYEYVGGAALTVPVADGQWHTLRLAVQGDNTIIYLDEQEIAQIDNVNTSGYMGLLSSQARVDFDDVVLGSPDGATTTAVSTEDSAQLALVALPLSQFEDRFDDSTLDAWKTVGGTWEIEDAQLRQLDNAADNVALLSPFHGASYSVSTVVRRLDSMLDAGLFFNMALPDARVTGHFVRLSEERGKLEWGHVDEATNLVVDGNIEVPEIGQQNEHVIEIEVGDGSASVKLNDRTAVESIPLMHTNGYVGLLSNQGPVAFDDVQVVASN